MGISEVKSVGFLVDFLLVTPGTQLRSRLSPTSQGLEFIQSILQFELSAYCGPLLPPIYSTNTMRTAFVNVISSQGTALHNKRVAFGSTRVSARVGVTVNAAVIKTKPSATSKVISGAIY